MNEDIKKAYLDKMNAQLREMNAKVEVVKARITKSTADVRLDYHKQIEKWHEKESQLKIKMEELRLAGADGFEAMKSKVQDIWNEVTNLTTQVEENKNNEKN